MASPLKHLSLSVRLCLPSASCIYGTEYFKNCNVFSFFWHQILMRLILYISTNHFVLQCFDAVCWGTQAVKIVICVTGWNIDTVLTFLIYFTFYSFPCQMIHLLQPALYWGVTKSKNVGWTHMVSSDHEFIIGFWGRNPSGVHGQTAENALDQ